MLHLLIAGILSLSILVSGCGDTPAPANQSSAEPALKSSIKIAGEDSRLNRRALFAFTEKDFEMLYKYVNANNVEAAERMVERGELAWIDNGTKVTILDRGIAKVRVEVIGGSLKGKTGYLAVEFIE